MKGSEAESGTTPSLTQASDLGTKGILSCRGDRRNTCTTAQESQHDWSAGKSHGSDPCHEGIETELCPDSDFSLSRGKENQDPQNLPRLAGEPVQMPSPEDAAVPTRRPAARPLPDLLTNIMRRSKMGGCSTSKDESLVHCFSKLDDSAAESKSSRASFTSSSPKSVKQLSIEAATEVSGQSSLHSSLGTSVDHPSSATLEQCPEKSCPLLFFQQAYRWTLIDSDGEKAKVQPEASSKERSHCQHFRCHICQPLHWSTQSPVTCPMEHNCLSLGQQSQSFHSTNVQSPDQVEEYDNARKATGREENAEKAGKDEVRGNLQSHDSTRFAGFFCRRQNVKEHRKDEAPQLLSLEPIIAVETGEARPEKTPVKGFRGMSMEGKEVIEHTRDSYWTPSVIERRNSFDKIPLLSPRFMIDGAGDEHSDKPKGFVSKVVADGTIQQTTASSFAENEELKSKRDLCVRSENSNTPKLGGSSRRFSKCTKCSKSNSSMLRRQSPKSSPNCPPILSGCPGGATLSSSTGQARDCASNRGLIQPCTSDSYHDRGRPGKHKFRRRGGPGVCSIDSQTDTSDSSTQANFRNCCGHANCSTNYKSEMCSSLLKGLQTRWANMKCCTADGQDLTDPINVHYCAPRKELYASSSSISSKAKGFSLRLHQQEHVCDRKTTKNSKKQTATSARLGTHQWSKLTDDDSHVNYDILDVLLRPDGDNGRQNPQFFYTPDSKVPTQNFEENSGGSCKLSLKTDLQHKSSAYTRSFTMLGRSNVDLIGSRELSPRLRYGRSKRESHYGQSGKQMSENQRASEIDDWLNRFIESNAECAAELLKCSIYFGSSL